MNEQHQGSDAIRYALAVSRRPRTVLLAAALGLGIMAAYAFLSPPIYEAATLLSVDKIAGDIAAPNDPRENPEDGYFETQVGLITSETQLRKVYEDLNLRDVPEFAGGIRVLRRAVDATAVPHTRLCYVNVESVDPRLAASIAGALAHAFVQKNLDNQLYMSKDILSALEAHARDPNAWKLIESLPAVVNNKVIEDLKTQIYDGQAELADLRTRYTDNHPAVRALSSKLQTLSQMRDHEMDTIVSSVKTELSGQFRANNARVIDEPLLPERPVRPRKALALAIGLGAGLALGIFLALLRENLDDTVLTPHDVERKLGLPFLSMVPQCPARSGGPAYETQLSGEATPLSEAFRNLRTVVKLADTACERRLLLVTSAVQAEGKSFVAASLAVAFSQLGEKVLLVDGDLRKPAQHAHFSCAAKPGLAEYLSGAVAEPGRIAQKTAIEGLELAPCGEPAKGPAELLSSARLGEFLAWARERYARVIVDCSPVFPVSDALLWGRHAGWAIFVARCGRARVPLITTACARLRAARIEILGSVLNGARVRTMDYAKSLYYERY